MDRAAWLAGLRARRVGERVDVLVEDPEGQDPAAWRSARFVGELPASFAGGDEHVAVLMFEGRDIAVSLRDGRQWYGEAFGTAPPGMRIHPVPPPALSAMATPREILASDTRPAVERHAAMITVANRLGGLTVQMLGGRGTTIGDWAAGFRAAVALAIMDRKGDHVHTATAAEVDLACAEALREAAGAPMRANTDAEVNEARRRDYGTAAVGGATCATCGQPVATSGRCPCGATRRA